jgi:hypothetical protein
VYLNSLGAVFCRPFWQDLARRAWVCVDFIREPAEQQLQQQCDFHCDSKNSPCMLTVSEGRIKDGLWWLLWWGAETF